MSAMTGDPIKQTYAALITDVMTVFGCPHFNSPLSNWDTWRQVCEGVNPGPQISSSFDARAFRVAT